VEKFIKFSFGDRIAILGRSSYFFFSDRFQICYEATRASCPASIVKSSRDGTATGF
jgi:hypothetical protein